MRKLKILDFFNFRYDINTNPGTANSVSTAAFRFVASLLPGVIQYYDNKGKLIHTVWKLRKFSHTFLTKIS